jgi:type I restriction enzyme S subunit
MSEENGLPMAEGQIVDSVLPLPSGWCWTTTTSLFSYVTSGSRGWAVHYSDHGPLFLRVGNLDHGSISLDLASVQHVLPPSGAEAERTLVKPGDVLISVTADVGMVGVVADDVGEAYINQHIALCRSKEGFCRQYLAWYLASQSGGQRQFKAMQRGATKAGLGLDDVKSVRVPLAPKDEQYRIVAKIEELFSNLDAGVAALERAKANLKRYRAAVLKAAVEGKLTEDWRAKHPTTEPASRLLERILTERRKKWEADQLAKFAATGKEPPKNWRMRYVEPTSPDTTDLPSIPASWAWMTLDALADVVGGITKDQKKANQPGMREVPYLRVANVQRGFLDLSEMKSISALEDDIVALRLRPGDVLFTEGGDRDKLGRGWVWSGELGECIHQNHIFRGRLISKDMQPRFVSHHGNTFGRDWFIKAGKQTTNLASINLGILRRFPVPIPPATEQAEIVARVDEKLSQIDAAETEIEHGLLRAARLRQSILKQAFEGTLVPQDPKEEPASVLLATLCAGRLIHETNGKSATPTRTRSRKKERSDN